MPLSASLRVLAMLCLTALLLATPNFHKPFSPFALGTAFAEEPSLSATAGHPTDGAVDAVKEKLRLVDHLNKAWRVPLVLAHRIVGAAYREAQAIGAAPTLLLALMAKESSFKPSALSGYGAVGLMQVVPRFHSTKVADGESLGHPETNIRVGAQVLGEYLEAAGGDMEPALRKYSGSARQYFQRVKSFQHEFETARAIDN